MFELLSLLLNIFMLSIILELIWDLKLKINNLERREEDE